MPIIAVPNLKLFADKVAGSFSFTFILLKEEYSFATLVASYAVVSCCMLAFIGLCLFCIYKIAEGFVNEIEKLYYNWNKKLLFLHKRTFRKTLSSNDQIILSNLSSYYRSLPEHLQNVFEYRVAKFCKDKVFLEHEDFKLDNSQKIHVAAIAIQLTFGYRYYNYDHFTRIHIFPEEYYYSYTGNYHAGEASMLGYIALSWNNFIKGEKYPHDNLNLGMHEFAHALFLNELRLRQNHPFTYWIKEWEAAMRKVKPIIEKSEFFREYAFTNNMEFFAVAVEHFFETPEDFQNKLPNGYELMCKLLNQNPLNPAKDVQT